MIKNGVHVLFARCMNIIFDSLLAQLVKYDVHTTRKIKSIHAIFITYFLYHRRSRSMLILISVAYQKSSAKRVQVN